MNQRVMQFVSIALAMAGGVLPGSSRADDSADKAAARAKTVVKVDKSATRNPVPVSIPAEREAAALAFARENHPELASLLDGLQKNAPKEYRAALVDLDRAVERLGKLKDRSPERHATELADWKITSRIRLLAARLTMSSDPTVEAELRATLRERLEMRLAAQRVERDRLQVRVSKLDQQIEELESKAEATVEKQFHDLKKSLPAKSAVKAKPKKSAPAAETKKP
ncbi:MAG: hypothetical protein JSS49_15450 [Planctomycetes bacterium]|nr:hypothetical protein [Planctomycetota bacterium]